MPEIIYKDQWICIVDKKSDEDSERLAEEMKMHAVHRLDRTTSGLLLLAVNKESAAELSRQSANNMIEKIYFAVVEGIPNEICGKMEDLLYHDRIKNKTYCVDRKRKGVKEAKLEYCTLKSVNGCSLLEIKLITGRTHQIRAQMASRKMPVYGDRKYGSKNRSEIALRSVNLKFTHPHSGEAVSFESYPTGKFGNFDLETK